MRKVEIKLLMSYESSTESVQSLTRRHKRQNMDRHEHGTHVQRVNACA